MECPVFSVTELNNYLKLCLEQNPYLRNICVMGEVSNCKQYTSGHWYFSLKDAEGTLSCVMFKWQASSLRFKPENGMTVMAYGKVSVYQRDGKYQLVVSAMMPSGAGDLQAAFEQLKTKLEAEGLFDSSRKKPLPRYPGKIAVITSPVGAAVRDVIRILGARWPMADVMVVPARVQGAEAASELREAVEYVNRFDLADVIIIGRGGGSAEDLWCFNDEALARAVYASRIPVISAVGHEPDVAMTDYTADVRASTPSNAAEICVPDRTELKKTVSDLAGRLDFAVDRRIDDDRKILDSLSQRKVLKDAGAVIDMRRMDLDMLSSRLCNAEQQTAAVQKHKIASAAAKLDALSPLKVLCRGYSMVSDKNGRVIGSVENLSVSQRIVLRMSDGSAECTVNSVNADTFKC